MLLDASATCVENTHPVTLLVEQSEPNLLGHAHRADVVGTALPEWRDSTAQTLPYELRGRRGCHATPSIRLACLDPDAAAIGAQVFGGAPAHHLPFYDRGVAKALLVKA